MLTPRIVETQFDVLGIRNAIARSADASLIDCEVNFRGKGWVPFTASAEDDVPHAVEVWTKLQAGEAGQIEDFVPPAPRLPREVSFRQFLLGMLEKGLFSATEAENASERRIPAALAQAIGRLGSIDAARVRIDWRTAANLRRSGNLTQLLVSAGIATEAQLDEVFIFAATQ